MRELLKLWLKALEDTAREDSGTVAVEYAMIAGAVSIAIVVALSDIETSLSSMYASLANGF